MFQIVQINKFMNILLIVLFTGSITAGTIGGGSDDSPIDIPIFAGGFGEALYDWNPETYPELTLSFDVLIEESNVNNFLPHLFDVTRLMLAFIFKQPAYLVPADGGV